jgi:MFS transporter, UMF1 family
MLQGFHPVLPFGHPRNSMSMKTPFLERIGLHRPELRAWAMYDWANSAVMTTIIAAVFPFFYTAVAGAGLPEGAAYSRYQIGSTIAIIVIAVLSPLLGALSDYRGNKKRLLAGFLALGAGAVAAMFFISHGDWLLGILLFMLANIGLMGGFVFYESLLPHIASNDEVDRVSTAGYSLGYLGGGILLALNLAWIMAPGAFGLPSGEGLTPAQATLPVRLAFLSVSVWWVVFAIPLFRRVPEPPRRLEADERPGESPTRAALTRLGETVSELRGYRQAALMLLAFFIYSDAIGAIIRMATVYGAEIGLERDTMITAILMTQLIGFPFAILFGVASTKFGAKPLVFVGLAVYMVISVLGFWMTTATHFLMLAMLVGTVQGGTQALSRSLFATLVPRHKSGEFFGFFGVIERFSGVMGIMVMWAAGVLTGSPRPGILALIVFFVIGGLLLYRVDIPAGQRAARAAEEAAGVRV